MAVGLPMTGITGTFVSASNQAQIEYWAKDLAPSTELRKWFHSGQGSEADFGERYHQELIDQRPTGEQLLDDAGQRVITLITATKDLERGHAVFIADWLRLM